MYVVWFLNDQSLALGRKVLVLEMGSGRGQKCQMSKEAKESQNGKIQYTAKKLLELCKMQG